MTKKHHASNMMSDIASTQNLSLALSHVAYARKKTNQHDDIWHVRFNWEKIKPQLQQKLLSGRYQLSPLQAFKIENTG